MIMWASGLWVAILALAPETYRKSRPCATVFVGYARPTFLSCSVGAAG